MSGTLSESQGSIIKRALPCFRNQGVSRTKRCDGPRGSGDPSRNQGVPPLQRSSGSGSAAIRSTSSFSNGSSRSKDDVGLSCRWRWEAHVGKKSSPWSEKASRRRTLKALKKLKQPDGRDVQRPLTIEVSSYEVILLPYDSVDAAIRGIGQLTSDESSFLPPSRPPSRPPSQPSSRPPSPPRETVEPAMGNMLAARLAQLAEGEKLSISMQPAKDAEPPFVPVDAAAESADAVSEAEVDVGISGLAKNFDKLAGPGVSKASR